jgi:hypothetical protein
VITRLDWINPVLIREYQQVVRSKVFMWVCALWLILQLFISLCYIGSVRPEDAALSLSGPGETYFLWITAGLAAVFFGVLPLSTFNRIIRERRDATLELLTISRVSAGQVVSGFLLVTLAQMGLFLFLAFPFLVFAYLFRGLELMVVFWGLFVLLLGGVAMTTLGLMAGSFCRTPRLTIVVRILVAIGFFVVALPVLGFLADTLFSSYGRSRVFGSAANEWSWLEAGLVTLAAGMVVTIGYVFARSNLLFEAANRTTLPRLTMSGVVLVAGAVVLAFAWVGTLEDEVAYAFDVIGSLVVLAYSCWVLGERNELTPRMREGLPANRLVRLLVCPYLPGRGTGFLFLLLNVGALSLFWHSALALIGKPWDYTGLGWIMIKTYFIFIIGLSVLAHHFIQRTKWRKWHFAVWFLIIFNVILWMPLFWGVTPFSDPSAFAISVRPDKLSAFGGDLVFVWRTWGAPLLGLAAAAPSVIQNLRQLMAHESRPH